MVDGSESTVPNFFCRPGKGRRFAKTNGNGEGRNLNSSSDTSAAGSAGHEEQEAPRLAFLRDIVDHHTKARDIRNTLARLEKTTNAWNVPMPGRSPQNQASKAPTATVNQQSASGSTAASYKSEGGVSASSKASDSTAATAASEGNTSYTTASTPLSSRTPSERSPTPPLPPPETTYNAPQALSSSQSPADLPPLSDGTYTSRPSHQQRGGTNPNPLQHNDEEKEEKMEKEKEEEPPWFSQLASLPHLRSAGIPLLQPSVPGASVQNRTLPAAPSTSAKLLMAASSTTPSRTLSDVASLPRLAASINGALPMQQSKDLETSLEEQDLQPLQPPDNFAMVNSWLYRSSFPKKKHFPFLRTLGLKSVLTLILEEYPEQNTEFLDDEGITFYQFGIPGNKEPFVQIPDDKIAAALVTMLDRRNHPMLVHCNKGKHRTGCLIGCLRKLQSWSLTTIFDEYRRFSFPKSRSMDQEFIELFDETEVWRMYRDHSSPEEITMWLPRWAVLDAGREMLGIAGTRDEDLAEGRQQHSEQHEGGHGERCDAPASTLGTIEAEDPLLQARKTLGNPHGASSGHEDGTLSASDGWQNQSNLPDDRDRGTSLLSDMTHNLGRRPIHMRGM